MYSLNLNLKNATFPTGIFTVYDVLNDKDIKLLIKIGESKLEKGGINENNSNLNSNFLYSYDDKPGYRNSNINFINYNSDNLELSLVYKKIINQIIMVNKKEFKYQLTDIEPFQFTSYKKGEYYRRHLDYDSNLWSGNIMRKLSASIQLSDPVEYEGGDLGVYLKEEPIFADKKKGSMSFFSSFTLHEITPVTEGTRNSLVVWAWGPRFV